MIIQEVYSRRCTLRMVSIWGDEVRNCESDNVFIGIKAIILMGTVIGNNSIVGEVLL